jgi:hypothetical protein
MGCPCCDPCRGPCSSGSDCATGCRCEGGQCVKECSGSCATAEDCDTGCDCVDGQCVPDGRKRCCEVDGVCVEVTPETQCDGNKTLFQDFLGTVTVSWCGLSITFALGDIPGQANFAIGVSGQDPFEKACGTVNWYGSDVPATYKDETKYLNILRLSNPSPCSQIAFAINTALQGWIVIDGGNGDIYIGGAGSDQKLFVFQKSACGQESLTLDQADVDIGCGGNAHKHCNDPPVITINEAP